MSYIKNFLSALTNNSQAEDFKVYEKSVNSYEDGHVLVIKENQEDFIVATNKAANKFEGESLSLENVSYVKANANHENLNVLREIFPFTKPIAVLDKQRSFGLGDRLGFAGEGHLRVMEKYDAYPILAQQSIRELTLTGRTYEDVLDAASLSVFKFGYKDGFGADGDHLKTREEIEYALRVGFTMITLDTSDYIKNDVAEMSDEEVIAAVELTDRDKEVYLDKTFNIDGHEIHFDEVSLKRTILIYRDSVAYATDIYNEYFRNAKNKVNFELSIDETATPTELHQHFYIANELANNDVKLDTIAPRFHGEFQKGVDYIGDLDLFHRELIVHVAIAEHFGYKLSIHSGSDKFSIFEVIGKETKGHFHVKTAGTNWLEAMLVVAIEDPKLYREIHQFALESFDDAQKLYVVTTDLDAIPNLDTLEDSELPELFKQNDPRQLIHITYGHILNAKDSEGNYRFKDQLLALWSKYSDTYADNLESHIGRHLELLYKGF